MNKKTRILILGIGGVGGYLGGKLAGRYAGSDKTEIIFLARGENLRVIGEKGLKVITPEGENTVFPNLSPMTLEKPEWLIF